MELEDIVGLSTTGLTLILFLCGLPECAKLRKQKSTKNVPSIFFLVGYFNTSLWVNYGLLLSNPMIYAISLLGVVLHAFYVGCYYSLTPDEEIHNLHVKIIGILLAQCGIIGCTQLIEPVNGIWLAGMIASTVTIFCIAAPLTELKTVIRTKSTATLQFPMTVVQLLLGLTVLWYGILLDDKFMIVPNAIGTTLSLFTLSLFFIYPPTPAKKIE